MATVIIGAGIIGTSTAYYLSESSTSPSNIHLVEASPQLFASASGYAAGFLARDWFSPTLSALGALSFDLHKQLAYANNGQEKWGYSRSTAFSLEETIGERGEDWLSEGVSRVRAANMSRPVNGDGDGDRPAWLTDHGKLEVISTGETTAQVYVSRLYMNLESCPSQITCNSRDTYVVLIPDPPLSLLQITHKLSWIHSDPLRLCQFLISTCLARGVQLHQPAQAISVSRDPSGALSSIRIRNSDSSNPQELEIPCRHLVLAAGAWTPKVFSTLFPESKVKIPVTSLAGHSLLLRSPHWPPSDGNGATSASSLLAGDFPLQRTANENVPEQKSANGDNPSQITPNGNPSPKTIESGDEPTPHQTNQPQSHHSRHHTFPPGFFLPSPPPTTVPTPAPTSTPTHALFTTDPHPYSPELFSRHPHHIYLAGLNSTSYPLPTLPTLRTLDPASITILKATAKRLLGDAVKVEREAVCWRPVTARGVPVVAAVEEVMVAAGHGAWGISLGVGTGWVVGQMVGGRDVRGLVGGLGL